MSVQDYSENRDQFVLDEILAGKDVFIDNYASAVTAVGWDFMAFG